MPKRKPTPKPTHPLTSAEKQAARNAALEKAAKTAGWPSWSSYVTYVKNGKVELPKFVTVL